MTRIELILKRVEHKRPIGLENFGHLLGIALASRKVRQAQVAYFADRTQSNLIESKQREKELDDLLNEPAEPFMVFGDRADG